MFRRARAGQQTPVSGETAASEMIRVVSELSQAVMSPHLGGGPRESKTLGISDDLSLCGVGRSNTKEIRAVYFKSRRKGPKSVISNPMDIITTFYLQFSAYKTGLRIYILGISFIILLSALYKIFFFFAFC